MGDIRGNLWVLRGLWGGWEEFGEAKGFGGGQGGLGGVQRDLKRSLGGSWWVLQGS